MKLSRSIGLFLGFLGCGYASLAAAAAPADPVEYPAACEKVSKTDLDKAHKLFLAAKKATAERDYEKAEKLLLDAYAVDCSMHELLQSLAVIFERKDDKKEAARALAEYLQRRPNAADRESVTARLEALREKIKAEEPPPPPAPVTVVAPPVAPAPPPPAPVEMKAPAAEAAQHKSIVPLIVTGAGAALAVSGAVLAAVEWSSYTHDKSLCPNFQCYGDASSGNTASSNGNSAGTNVKIGEGLAIGGVAVAASGLIWYFLEPRGGEKQVSFTPTVVPGAVFGSLSGRF